MFKFLAQDESGWIFMYPRDPEAMAEEWQLSLVGEEFDATLLFEGTPNPDWRDTKIDLMKDNFKIEGGILSRTTLRAPAPDGTHDQTVIRSEWEARGKPFDIEYFHEQVGWTRIRYPSWLPDTKYRVMV